MNNGYVERLKGLSLFDRLDEVYIVGGMGEVKLKYLGDDMVLLNGIKKEEVTQGTRVEDQEWSRNFKWGRAQDLQCLVLIEMMLIKRLKEKEKTGLMVVCIIICSMHHNL